MILQFNKGDIVRTPTGNKARIENVTALYSLDDGSVWNNDALTLIKSMDTDEDVVEMLCSKLNVSYKDIKRMTRVRYICYRRQIISYVLNLDYEWTLARIGRAINRKHCTVYSSIKHVNDLLSINDKYMTELLQKVREKNN